MKIVVVALVVLMMLAGGSFSVLKWMQVGPFAPEPDATEVVVSDEPPVFIDLDPLLINIFQGNSVATTVQISVKVEALGSDNADLIKESIPKITDYFLRDLHAFLPRIMTDDDTRIDIFVIKKRLKLMADRLYPDGRINDVLIQSVSEGS